MFHVVVDDIVAIVILAVAIVVDAVDVLLVCCHRLRHSLPPLSSDN